jgi:hypothetical protein
VKISIVNSKTLGATMEALELISPADAATMLRVKKQTLAVWRCAKRQPLPYVKMGRRVFYKRRDIERFVERNTLTGAPSP